jgi:hypothetical protein
VKHFFVTSFHILPDALVKEIIEKGGSAISDNNSVLDAEKIIQRAIETFGSIIHHTIISALQ